MNPIKIGTRNSPLAIWQAREVARRLQNLNYKTEIIPVNSEENPENYSDEDKELFTADLDAALRTGEIDIAVHAMKDLPSDLSENTEIFAVLKRDYAEDVLVRNSKSIAIPMSELKVATNDVRRKAFWLREFPHGQFHEIRGNANTRLEDVEEENAEGTIISLARLKRLNLNLKYEAIPFVFPAPTQGIVAVLGKSSNTHLRDILQQLTDKNTAYCALNETGFRNVLQNEQKFAVGAFAEILDGQIRIKGLIVSNDGKNSIETDDIFPVDYSRNYGEEVACEILGREKDFAQKFSG